MSSHLVWITPNHTSLPFTVFERADTIESEKIVLYEHQIYSRYGALLFLRLLTLRLCLPGARGLARGWGSEVTGAERWATRAALRTGSGAQRADSTAQPGPPGAAGPGDPSGAAPTTGLRLRARGAAPAGGPLRWAGNDQSSAAFNRYRNLQCAQWFALLLFLISQIFACIHVIYMYMYIQYTVPPSLQGR